MTDLDFNNDEITWHTDEDLPTGRPEGAQRAYEAILGRHLLTTLRQASGQTLT